MKYMLEKESKILWILNSFQNVLFHKKHNISKVCRTAKKSIKCRRSTTYEQVVFQKFVSEAVLGEFGMCISHWNCNICDGQFPVSNEPILHRE